MAATSPVNVDAAARSFGDSSVVLAVTQTLDTSAYASGDTLATALINFGTAVGTNGSGFIEKMVISDHDVQSQPLELWLFNAVVTPAAANAAHSISDADSNNCIGVIYSGPYYASALNSVSVARGVGLAINCPTGILYGILVTRGTPTYTVNGLVVSLQISQN